MKESSFYAAAINKWPEGERPSEKLKQSGIASLTDSELIALILGTGIKEITSLDIARSLLIHLGNLPQLANAEYQEFQNFLGIGQTKAMRLAASFELGRRVISVPETPRIVVDDPELIFNLYSPRLSRLKKEVFMVLVLNAANILVRAIKISEGTLNATFAHARDVFRAAVLESAASIILLHNHPSGQVQPSKEDRQLTKQLVKAGKIVDIPVIDHIIVGNKQYFSFRQAGYIETT